MIVRDIGQCPKVEDPQGQWNSIRMLLKEDKMGFSFHVTTIYQGSKINMHYVNHLESVYCISGQGEITDLKLNKSHRIVPGTLYALNEHDEHVLSCSEEMKLACVFNPPIKGDEVHNQQGAYEID
jgi:L-ectoine synthase